MRPRWSLITSHLLAAGFAPLLLAPWSAGAQLHLSGSIEYQGRAERREAGDDASAHIGTVRMEGWSTLGAPWIGDLSAGLAGSLGTSRQGEAEQDTEEVTGMARLRLLPQSKLPFEAFVERRDSQVEGELIGPSYLQTQWGVKQAFLPAPASRVLLNYIHTEQDTQTNQLGASATHSSSEVGGLSLSHAMDHHQWDARSDFTDVRHDQPARHDRTQLHLLRHRYSPSSDFSVDSLATALSSSISENDGSLDTQQLQWNSNLFWRPATSRPSYLSASVIALDVDPSGGSASQAQTRTLLASGNYVYQWRQDLSLRFSASANETRSADQDNLNTLLRGGVTYSPAEIPLGSYFYHYALGGDLGYATDDQAGDHELASAIASHGVARSRPLWSGMSAVNLNQQVAVNHDTDTETVLSHSATLDWNRSAGSSSTYARLLASDTRRIDGVSFTFSLLNAQASGVLQTSRFTAWSGNATWQLSHSTSDGSASPWLSSASVYVNYSRDRVLGIALMRFTSELRALTEDLATASASPTSLDKRETLSWTNRLDYVVGKTQMSLRASVSEIDGRRYSLLQFLLRRYFGRLPR